MKKYEDFFSKDESGKWMISKDAPKDLLVLVKEIHDHFGCEENEWILDNMSTGFYVVWDSIKGGYEWESMKKWIMQGVFINPTEEESKKFLNNPFAEEYCGNAMDKDPRERDIFRILKTAERLALVDLFEDIWDFLVE